MGSSLPSSNPQLSPDPYQTLGVDKKASFQDIRSAYKKLVLALHPDRSPDDAAKAQRQERFYYVQAAYELLSDENRRRLHDDRVYLAKLRQEHADRISSTKVASTTKVGDTAPDVPHFLTRKVSPEHEKSTRSMPDPKASDITQRNSFETPARDLSRRGIFYKHLNKEESSPRPERNAHDTGSRLSEWERIELRMYINALCPFDFSPDQLDKLINRASLGASLTPTTTATSTVTAEVNKSGSRRPRAPTITIDMPDSSQSLAEPLAPSSLNTQTDSKFSTSTPHRIREIYETTPAIEAYPFGSSQSPPKPLASSSLLNTRPGSKFSIPTFQRVREMDHLVDETLKEEPDQKWILNKSVLSKDQPLSEKFYFTYTENPPSRWRNITVSCDYRNSEPISLESDLRSLRHEHDKSMLIYDSIQDSLLDVKFYDTVTNLRLETLEGRLHVHVTEDKDEIFSYPSIKEVANLGLPRIPLSRVQISGHVRGFVYKVRVGSEKYLFKTFGDPAGAKHAPTELRALSGPASNCIQYLVIDDAESVIRGYLVSDQDSRIAIQGIGGAGKTQLALQYGLTQPQFKTGPPRENIQKVAKKKRGLSGFVNGKRKSAVADTGASHNVVSAAFVEDEGLTVTGAPATLRLGNSTKRESLGTVSFNWAFAEDPQNIIPVVCHVLPQCIYDIILGSGFLTATQTLSKYKRRLTKCFFSVAGVFRFGLLGNTYQRLCGRLGKRADFVLAVPDTGAEGNVMDMDYAIANGYDIKTGARHRRILQFADGSYAETVGQVFTTWTFESGEQVPVTFEILKDCCSDVVIGEEIIYEYNVFEDHTASIVTMEAAVADEYDLAPFDFVRPWNRWYDSMVDKIKGRKPQHGTSDHDGVTADRRLYGIDAAEQQRREKWNFEHDFGNTATEAEKKLEAAKRKAYDDALKQARSIPSIPTAPPTRRLPLPGGDHALPGDGGYSRSSGLQSGGSITGGNATATSGHLPDT